MTKNAILLVCALFLSFASYGQLGEPRAINMLDFGAPEQDVAAIYLLNNGHTEVRYDRTLNTWFASTQRIYRVRILTEDALDLANVKIRLHLAGKMAEERQYVDEINATTYSFNIETGRIEKAPLSKRNIYRTKINEKTAEVSFSLPKVQVGSVLEVSYTKHSPFIDQLEDWHFQKDYPVKRSRFDVTIPAFFVYVFQLQGYFKTKASNVGLDPKKRSFGRYTYQELKAYWQMENMPAFREESFMTTREDYISKLVFQIQSLQLPDYERNYLKTWEAVTHDLQNSHRFKLFYEGKKDFTAFPLSKAANPLVRAQEIYESFKKAFTWNQYYGVYPDAGFKKMMIDREGNASSMGLTLFQSLVQAGLDARPVLISPRSNGAIAYNYPFYDKLIATMVRLEIDGKVYLLDPLTDVPFGYLNGEFINGKGLILSDKVQWVDLTRRAIEQKSSTVQLQVSGDSISGQIELKMADYGMVSASSNPEELFKSDWDVLNVQIAEDELTSRKILAHIKKEIDDDLILIPLTFDELIFGENPLKPEERLYPLDFYYKKRYSYQLTIQLSEEYTFESLPENKIVRLAGRLLDMSINVSQIGSKANITFLFWTRTNSFDARHYSKVREAYELMGSLENTAVVVKKKT